MKKTVSVNIKGMNFMIEEDAYEILHDYMLRLEKSLKGQKGAKDIVEDIELRIAELCQQFLSDKKQVIEKEDIESITKTLGEPEDFLDEEHEAVNEPHAAENSSYQAKEKRLYRDIENAKIAGICSGLSNYFHIDVIIVRIIFLMFLFIGGFGFPLYIILWIVIPKTASTIDRLKMRGKAITVDSVKEEIEQAADRVAGSSRSFAEKVRKDQSYTKCFSRIGRLISSIFGLALLGFGLLFLIVFLVISLGGLRFIPIQSDQGFLSFSELGELVLNDSNDIFLCWIGILLVSFSVILFLISNGTYLLMKVRTKWTKISSISLFGFGVIGAAICIYMGMKTTRDLVSEAEIERQVATVNATELVLVPMKEKFPGMGEFELKNQDDFTWISVKKNSIHNRGIQVIYRESKDSLFHVYQNFSAHGHSYRNALKKAKNIRHKMVVNDSRIQVNTTYQFPKSDKFRDQEARIIIEIPKDKWVKIGGERINMDELEEDELEKQGFLEGSGEYDRWD